MSLEKYREQQNRIKSAESIFANYPAPPWAPDVTKLAIILVNPRSKNLTAALCAMMKAPIYIDTRDAENNRIIIAEFECIGENALNLAGE